MSENYSRDIDELNEMDKNKNSSDISNFDIKKHGKEIVEHVSKEIMSGIKKENE